MKGSFSIKMPKMALFCLEMANFGIFKISFTCEGHVAPQNDRMDETFHMEPFWGLSDQKRGYKCLIWQFFGQIMAIFGILKIFFTC